MLRLHLALLLFVSPLRADTPDDEKSAAALLAFKQALATKSPAWAEVLKADCCQVPLTKADAATARELLRTKSLEVTKAERAEELKAKKLTQGKLEMPFGSTTFGKKPKDGYSLWISMHGGGGAPAKVNDQQWENQKKLYKLDEGIYVAPRAPTNTWNLWHEAHIDTFFARLIEDYIAVEGVNPDRVYILGYSAGGDGVYQLAPRLADRFAAAGMMAGHPNDASPLGLRNLPFALQVGGNDSAYNRNTVAAEWGRKLDELHKTDPKGYDTYQKIHEGKGHWMDREDAAALPWMAKKTRNPTPDKVVWKQAGTTHNQFYWLAVPQGSAKGGTLLAVQRDKNTLEVTEAKDITKFIIRCDDRMQDLDTPIVVMRNGKELQTIQPTRTAGTLLKTLLERGDAKLMFDFEAEVTLKE